MTKSWEKETNHSLQIPVCVGNIYGKGQNGNIYYELGISPTISSGTTETKGNGGIGSNNAPKVLFKEKI